MMLASLHHSHTRRTQLQVNPGTTVSCRPCCEPLENRRLLSFTPAVNYATVGTPSAIVTADFNNDGKLDLVTCANAETGSYSVFLGNGAGGFGAAQRTVIGSGLSSMAIADFNNDAKLDLVVSDYEGFRILMGNGNGTFQPALYPVFKTMAAVGDFNNDGNTDVLATWIDGDWATHFQVYRGNGQGGFAATSFDAYYYGWGGTAAVDLDNDANLDVVTSEGVVFLGNGDGSFEFDWEQPLPGGGAIATGDFTGDGNADAIAAGYENVAVLRGRGDGTFDAPITYPAVAGTLHTGVATADFNGDGKLDAVVSIENTGTVRLMLGNGDGTLRDGGAFATGTSPSGVVVGDFNRDGRPDVAVSNAVSRTVSVLLNDGNWATKTYVGPTGGGSWSTAANWSPAGVPTAGDVVTISGKSVTVSASATVASLTLTGGASLTVASNGSRILRTSVLSISSNSKLNLSDNDLLIDYAPGGASPYAALRSYVLYGRNTGTGGIVTTATAANDTILALADNTAFGRTIWGGQPIDPTTVIGKYTYYGDANLDGRVTSDDYVAVDVGLGTGNSWIAGDLNYSGTVTSDDYVVIDVNLGKGMTTPLATTEDAGEGILAGTSAGTSNVDVVEAAGGKYKVRKSPGVTRRSR